MPFAYLALRPDTQIAQEVRRGSGAMDRDPVALDGPLRALSMSVPTADHMAWLTPETAAAELLTTSKIPETKEP